MYHILDNIFSSKKTKWVLPTFIVLSVFLFLLAFEKTIDALWGFQFSYVLSKFFATDVNILANTIGGMGEVAPAILAIALTVIAIVVELVAGKYSAKIIDLFIEDKRNSLVISLFVVTSLNQIMVANTLSINRYSSFSVLITMLMLMLCILVIIPYFNYVFTFLHPNSFINHIKDKSKVLIDRINEENVEYSRRKMHEYIDFLGDIAINSVNQSDRAAALDCVKALTSILIDYQDKKDSYPVLWYKLSALEYTDPDFTDFSPYVLNSIENKRIWVERKIFKLFELLFINTHKEQRDVASGVLMNIQNFAKHCIYKKNETSLFASFQMINTLLRISINDHSPRSAFNILEHYRVIAEILVKEMPENVTQVAEYIKYYAQESQKNNIIFILETAAHDLFLVNCLAFEKNIKNKQKVLEIFLMLDQPVHETGEETKELPLIGVRIAQAKLAAFYLLKNREDLAKQIFEDMKDEPISRINKIKNIIQASKQEEFFEFTGRGINFFYVPDELKNYLQTFFEWF